MSGGSERRVYPRVPFTAKVEAESEGRSFLAVACDISVGGMKIFTANPLSAGQFVQLTFQLPGAARPMQIRGIVRHLIVGQGMGVEFMNLTSADLAAINAFISGTSP